MKLMAKQKIFLLSAFIAAAGLIPAGCSSSRTGGFETKQTSTKYDPSAETVSADAAAIFGKLKGVSFSYSGSSANWKTNITFGENGSFTGTYTDNESGMTGKKYSKGTIYTSSFSGNLTLVSQDDKLTYQLKVADLTLASETGVETIKNKVRYITTNAYGLETGDELTLYLPGYKSSSLPDGFREIASATLKLLNDLPDETNFCGIYDKTQNSGFVSDNYLVSSGSNSFEAYFNLLSYYKSGIERYNWKYSAHTRPSALCDINGDGTKELLFFTSDTDAGPGILHIFTYSGTNAVEVKYPFKSVSDGSDSAQMFSDVNTGSGTSYVIYKDKEDNAIWIYRRYGNPDISYFLYEYKLNDDNTLEEVSALKKTSVSSGESESVSMIPNDMQLVMSQYDANDDGSYDDGSADDGSYDDGTYDDGSADDGSYDDSTYDDGSYDDGSYDDGTYDDGSYDDGSADDGSYDDGSTDTVNALSADDGIFTKNGKEITRDEGASAFEDGFASMGDVLLYSSPTNDVSIWNSFDSENIEGLSYEDMIARLSE